MRTDGPPTRVGHCLSPETLAAYRSGSLPGGDAAAVASHLADCEHCSSEYALTDPTATADYRSHRITRDRADPTLDYADPAAPPESARTVYGGYEVYEELGRGGMGVVFRARHVLLDRPAAVKVLGSGYLAGPEARSRFVAEGAAVAKFDHPNIVRIYEFAEQGGELFFAMELVGGGSLAELLRGGPLPPDRAAEVVEGLARAVEYAHGRGVIHRDLKPANVLIAADGTPKVADFGLAMTLEPGAELPGERAGTPAYMAPEQVRGEPAGPATDVYGLGAILYECLAGRPPFQGATRREMFDRVLTDEPAWPQPLARRVPADLDAAVRRCLAKDPAKRYPTAGALADDLARYRRRWRRRIILAGLAAAVVAGGGAAGVALWPTPDDARKRVEAKLARGEAVTLIGGTGRPVWSNIFHGSTNTTMHLGPDGSYRVVAEKLILIELLRDPGRESYNVGVDLRHVSGDTAPKVGLFLCNRLSNLDGVVSHTQVNFCFNDAYDESDVPVAPGMVPPPRRGNELQLRPRVFAHESGQAVANFKFGGQKPVFFPPAGPDAKWRRLEIEVRPDRLTGWLFEPGGARDPAKAAKLDLAATEKDFGQRHPIVKLKWFPPRGRLGLLVSRSEAAFRNLTVEPVAPGGPAPN